MFVKFVESTLLFPLGATLEQISAMVEEIGREFKKKQAQLGPLMGELKRVRQGIILTLRFADSLAHPLYKF